jgi:hypothetical protein
MKFLSSFLMALAILIVVVPFLFTCFYVLENKMDEAIFSMMAIIPLSLPAYWIVEKSVDLEFKSQTKK